MKKVKKSQLKFCLFIHSGNGEGIQCCSEGGDYLKIVETRHPTCLPIDIPSDDPFYSKFGQKCMNFVRTTPAPRLDCLLGYTEQVQIIYYLMHHN